jgi:hypothetical protein
MVRSAPRSMRSWATSGFARVRLDDVVEGSAGVVRVAAVGVGAVIEKPLERFRFEILARCEEHRKPAPAEPVDVGTVTNQKLHHRNAAGVRHSHERHVVDEDLAKFGDGGQECLDAREVVGGDRLLELLGLIAGVAEVGTIGKFHERNPFRGPDASLTLVRRIAPDVRRVSRLGRGKLRKAPPTCRPAARRGSMYESE